MQQLLRYPGGKSKVARKLAGLVPRDALFFCEPFCGSAAVAIEFARHTKSIPIILCDIDPLIVDLLSMVIRDERASELICRIGKFTPSVDAYYEHKEQMADGFSLMIVNRLSFGGRGGGPIGGNSQTGQWKVNARWNADALIDGVRHINSILRDRTMIYQRDGIELIRECEKGGFIYADPPYVAAGPTLYDHCFDIQDHDRLFSALSHTQCSWALSYDRTDMSNRYDSIGRRFTLNVTRSKPYGGGENQDEVLYLSDGLFMQR